MGLSGYGDVISHELLSRLDLQKVRANEKLWSLPCAEAGILVHPLPGSIAPLSNERPIELQGIDLPYKAPPLGWAPEDQLLDLTLNLAF